MAERGFELTLSSPGFSSHIRPSNFRAYLSKKSALLALPWPCPSLSDMLDLAINRVSPAPLALSSSALLPSSWPIIHCPPRVTMRRLSFQKSNNNVVNANGKLSSGTTTTTTNSHQQLPSSKGQSQGHCQQSNCQQNHWQQNCQEHFQQNWQKNCHEPWHQQQQSNWHHCQHHQDQQSHQQSHQHQHQHHQHHHCHGHHHSHHYRRHSQRRHQHQGHQRYQGQSHQHERLSIVRLHRVALMSAAAAAAAMAGAALGGATVEAGITNSRVNDNHAETSSSKANVGPNAGPNPGPKANAGPNAGPKAGPNPAGAALAPLLPRQLSVGQANGANGGNGNFNGNVPQGNGPQQPLTPRLQLATAESTTGQGNDRGGGGSNSNERNHLTGPQQQQQHSPRSPAEATTNFRNLPPNGHSPSAHHSPKHHQQQQSVPHSNGISAATKRSGSTCSSSSTLSSAAAASAIAAGHPPIQRFFAGLPPTGTPLDAQFQCLQAAGQMVGGHWQHFTAQATVGNDKEASVLLFDKKCNVKGPARLGRINRLGLADLLRYELQQLQQLAHPRILRLLHPLTENKEMLAFACEPLQCTLDKLFEQFERPEDGGAPLEALEKKLGSLQLIEGLSYLHNNAKMLHGNLTPKAVFLTSLKHWKIGGFAFSVAPKKPNTYPCFPWTKKLPACLQPELDFLAPEYLAPGMQNVTTAADVFSLGALICWVYAGGRRLIDVQNCLESYQIVIDQLDVALEMLASELGQNLKASLAKVLSREVEQRPAVQLLALTKHFDDPALGCLRQLDDLAQEFDPANKAAFLGQTLCALLPQIPEPLWFRRVLRRFNEHLEEAQELFPSLLRPLSHMLQHCESHNIHRLRPWFRRIMMTSLEDKMLSQGLLDQMPIIFRRLSDEQVEDRCFDLLIQLLQGADPHLKQNAVRALPQIVDFIPGWFVSKRLIPVLQSQAQFFQEHIPRQIDLLVAIAHLSDRCDASALHYLLALASVCSTLHPAIVHSKSRLVQRILTCDVSRLRDPVVIAHHLLNPLVLGLALPEMSPAHFDDVMSSSRILLDIVEQLRYESDDSRMKENNGRRLCNRRVSMSSNHLPRLLITAARPSIGGDGRKMSFLSADGRLEDRGSRRESKDSRCSLESEVSLRICNGSDVSDESALGSSVGGGTAGGGGAGGGCRQIRRKSWLEGYMHSISLEQHCSSSGPASAQQGGGGVEVHRANSSIGGRMMGQHQQQLKHQQSLLLEQRPFSTMVRKMQSSPKNQLTTATSAAVAPRNRSPDGTAADKPVVRPNSFTNLGHNLACTLWKTFY